MFKKSLALFLATGLLLTGCGSVVQLDKPAGPAPIPEVSSGLVDLLKLQEGKDISGDDYPSQSFSQFNFNTLATPLGYRINLRISELVVPLVEALRHFHGQDSAGRLIDLAQWGSTVRIRSQALVALAGYSNPDDLAIFRNVLTEQDPALRCAAIEALQIWNQEGAIELLKTVAQEKNSPVVQLFATQALLALGDKSVLPVLYKGLESGSWIVRALSARYLGDYGDGSDYEKLSQLVNRETQNDFVIAEAALSALKLFSRKEQAMVSYAPASKIWRDNDDVRYWLREDKTIDVEPLVILPPRLYIHDSNSIAPVINTKLLALISTRLEEPLSGSDETNPDLQQLYHLDTPTGFALKTRYSKLSYLVAEGLAGTKDLLLRNELERLALDSKNATTKATALVSLAFGATDFPSAIQQSLSSEDPTVRFGAIESVVSGRFKQAIPSLMGITQNDPIPAFRVVALGALFQLGDPSAPNFLRAFLTSEDWPSRSLAFWYLGRYGERRDFSTALNAFSTETNPFVKTEIILAVLRLQSLQDEN